MTKPFVSLGFVFIFAMFQFVRFGNLHDYLFLAVGSCLSGTAIFGHGFIPVLDRGRKSWLLSFLVLSGSIPYGFGCYLVFYRGFWGLRGLLARFTVGGLLVCALFIIFRISGREWDVSPDRINRQSLKKRNHLKVAGSKATDEIQFIMFG
jgi:hypothetical protein